MSNARRQRDTDNALFVTCIECEERKSLAVEEANEAIAFYRRHHAIAGHDLDWEQVELNYDLSVLDGIETTDAAGRDAALEVVVERLDTEFDCGVPIGIVAAAMGTKGISIGETTNSVRRVRMNGLLYEPRDDYLSGI